MENIEMDLNIKEKILEYCNEYQIELNEEYVKRVQLLYNHVNIANPNPKKIILYGRPGVGKTNMIQTTSALVNSVFSKYLRQ